MDRDPCWVPSAIMQTMGALIGIYTVIYVLVAQRDTKKKLNYSSMVVLHNSYYRNDYNCP